MSVFEDVIGDVGPPEDGDAGRDTATLDPHDVRLARSAKGILHAFNTAGVLAPADVHVARRIAMLAGERDGAVALAAALAVRAPRLGHVHVDLRTIRATAAVEGSEGGGGGGELEALPWPETEAWCEVVAGSGLVAVEARCGGAGVGSGVAAGEEVRPFRYVGGRLYLERLWSDERAVAAELLAKSALAEDAELGADARGALERLLEDPRQRLAAETALRRRLSVIAGGPGTGKTTTVARALAALFAGALAQDEPLPLVALAAPTGKAAARLTEAVHDEAHRLEIADEVRDALLALEAVTLHRLLGRRRDSDSRFRHDRRRPLAHDVVIVDETSMVPLSLMARLLEAVRTRARLVLVGDPGQLASVEAGAVLGDIVGPAVAREPAGLADLAGAAGPGRLRGSIVVLDRVHRFGGAIAELADAVRRGDAERAVTALESGGEEVVWIAEDTAADALTAASEPLRRAATTSAAEVVGAARAGDARAALEALTSFRLLCAHRRGPHGVTGWSARVLAWLASTIDDFDPEARWYAGRPLLVTENDYELGLFNGDTGVVVARPEGRTSAAFARRGEVVEHSAARLSAVDTVYAMTIHKSQGSQFRTAAVVLPPPDSRLLSRELLYTALTRAERHLIVAGSPESVRAAVERPIARASGLAGRLWEFTPAGGG